MTTLPCLRPEKVLGGLLFASTPVACRLEPTNPHDAIKGLDASGQLLAQLAGATALRRPLQQAGPTPAFQAACHFLHARHGHIDLPPG